MPGLAGHVERRGEGHVGGGAEEAGQGFARRRVEGTQRRRRLTQRRRQQDVDALEVLGDPAAEALQLLHGPEVLAAVDRAAELGEGPASAAPGRSLQRPGPTRACQSSMAQALLQAHWLTKWVVKASPSTASAASSTRCPSDSQSEAAARTAATQSACTALPVGESVMTATRRRAGAVAAAAAKEGPRSGGAQ